MKTPTDDIFQLIHSMTAAEKRYFKIHFSSEKSLVTELFNYLNGMKSYNEENHHRTSTKELGAFLTSILQKESNLLRLSHSFLEIRLVII